MEIPYNGRAIIVENFDGIEIVVPSKKNTFLIVFLGFWLCGWVLGEIFGLRSVSSDLFSLVWICGWTLGGAMALRAYYWMMFGKEIITVGQGTLTIDKRGALLSKPKVYDLRESKNFRVYEEFEPVGPFGNRNSRGLLNLGDSGTIKFDYGLETVKFADSMYEAEANFILKKLRDKKYIS
ncbi:hypothetical protein [Mucilaginibacter xinganensis]|uniref:PH domain-containing protein n=1 Tax=Mucilaginibacter xinganensis TaxID=1234841 RepID=A0A223P1X4_9SPHI|nr:hypothetical protein [Mucilaginibacter xinganensis]ASU36125.1 hypothetical protein MuYL_4240 [Mucilaginibacter xinganensis]